MDFHSFFTLNLNVLAMYHCLLVVIVGPRCGIKIGIIKKYIGFLNGKMTRKYPSKNGLSWVLVKWNKRNIFNVKHFVRWLLMFSLAHHITFSGMIDVENSCKISYWIKRCKNKKIRYYLITIIIEGCDSVSQQESKHWL